MKKFLRYQLDGYLRGRGQERNEEKPQLRVEPHQGYIHYNKGGQLMYALQDYIGEDRVSQALEDRVSQALAAMTKDYAFKGRPYPTSVELEDDLRKVTPPEFQYLYEDWFENITIFDNRAVSATYSPLPSGKYQVRIAVEAKKYRSDGKGQEHLIPAPDLVDIGVLDGDGKFLYLQKHKIEQEHQEFTVTVDKVPSEAGIDPLIKLIDRNPDDNIVTARKQQGVSSFSRVNQRRFRFADVDSRCSSFIVWRIGSRKRSYFLRVASSREARAVSTAFAVAGVTISSRPTKTRTICVGAGLIMSGKMWSMNPRGTM
jgi:hypothetical protein